MTAGTSSDLDLKLMELFGLFETQTVQQCRNGNLPPQRPCSPQAITKLATLQKTAVEFKIIKCFTKASEWPHN